MGLQRRVYLLALAGDRPTLSRINLLKIEFSIVLAPKEGQIDEGAKMEATLNTNTRLKSML